MISRTTAFVMLAALLAASAAQGATREWHFDVSLDGRAIGEHRFVLREDAERRELLSEARFRVKILFYEAYRYDHRAEERWRGDCLESLDARTDDNGELKVVTASDAAPLADCVQTFAYWNPSILEARRLLNPQTGEYVDVTVQRIGRETVDGQPAERYRLLGGGRTPLSIDLWYSPSRDWLALESLTPEGRRLRYARK
jgi:hypothetical protein